MRTLGPSTVPHQLQVAVIEVLIFGPTRKPAYAFPSMSLKRTMGAMSGAIAVVLRLPIQIAAGLRVATLLDEIGRSRSDPLREYMVKTLAASVWREHPGVIKIRAVFGSLNLPRAEEFERGKRESYDFLYAYDFSRAEEPAKAENH